MSRSLEFSPELRCGMLADKQICICNVQAARSQASLHTLCTMQGIVAG